MTVNTIQPSRAKPVVFSLLTLLSGIVIGAGATLMFIGLPSKEPGPPLPEEFSRRMVQRLTRELDLTPEQRKAIRPVVESHMTAMDEIRDEARPKIRRELEAMNSEILALLDERQQQMWKDHIERMQRRFHEFRERRGPGDGSRRREGGPGDGRNRFRRPNGARRDPNTPFFRQRPFEDLPNPGDMPLPDPLPKGESV